MKIDGGTHKIQLFIKSMGPNKDVLLKEDEAENNSHEQLFIKEFLILWKRRRKNSCNSNCMTWKTMNVQE